MAHPVKCIYCGERFDRDNEPFVEVSKNRYGHKDCYDGRLNNLTEEERNKILLQEYILKLFNYSVVPVKVQRQIDNFIDIQGYTYTGMLQALQYFFSVQGHSTEKANGGIGIIPYVYEDANQYFLNIYKGRAENDKDTISLAKRKLEKTKTIYIKSPQRRIKEKKEYFTFLD